jgi:eukaryotic translation initiation factor 2C
LKGVKIIGRVPGPDGRPTQHRKIYELSRLSAAKSEFTMEGKKTNVAVRPILAICGVSSLIPYLQAFFKSHHNITLRHPDWPCVKVSKVALWPIELCDVKPGQKYIGRLDPVQTAEVLKVTTVKPVDRIPLLKAGINEISPRTGVSAYVSTPAHPHSY